ncbi:MAG: type II toxin-antitoxin system RelE/ParE family toxin [Bacteroidia bacterium]
MVEIIWSNRSQNDLFAIYEFIAKDSPFYATRWINYLIESVEVLEEFPLSGRIVPEKNTKTIRELIIGNYRIFYKVTTKRIYILRIHHGSSKIKI